MLKLKKFYHDEFGAITVEFVVIGGAIVAASIAMLFIVAGGIDFRADTDSELIADTDRNSDAIDLIQDAIDQETASD